MGLDSSGFADEKRKRLYQIYAVFVTLALNVYFPFHLTYGLLQQTDPQVILESTAMCLVVMVCTFKAFDSRRKLSVFRRLGEISKSFERKAKLDQEQYALILEFKSKSQRFLNSYFAASGILICFAILTILTFDSRELLHPTGYFPYDYTKSRTVYVVTTIYQFSAWVIQVLVNIFYDTYPGMFYFLLSQHVRILNLRVAKIGYDPTFSKEENHQLLREAVNDHNQIIEFYKTVQETVSLVTFVLFVSTSMNIVTCVVSFTFFADSTFQKVFFIQLAVCYAMETILGCYYGSEFEIHIDSVTSALYSCKWYEQTQSFRKDLGIFMTCSVREYNFMAGGLIPVSKLTFLSIMRGVFSLYTLMDNMREKI